MSLSQEIVEYISEHKQETYELLLALAAIPAPSNHEECRAEFCKSWLEAQGAKGVYIDKALNVIYPVGCGKDNELIVFMAHTDVVFPDRTPLSVVVEQERILAPGIGDDTANLCALLMVAKYIAHKNIESLEEGILLVANAGEEGLGNLKGSRQVCEDFKGRIKAFYSFDSYIGELVVDAVGSKRYKVEIKTEGGHSYGDYGNKNAIYYLASLINTLYTLIPPCSKKKTTYNVGTISGGTSVNTIAQRAEMLYEFRSDSKEDLTFMEQHFISVINSYRRKGIQVEVTLVGERPCKGKVDELKQSEIIGNVIKIIKEHSQLMPTVKAGSTDCNISLYYGIPSVCLGVCKGGGAHTREEWVERKSLIEGYRIAFDLILSYLE